MHCVPNAARYQVTVYTPMIIYEIELLNFTPSALKASALARLSHAPYQSLFLGDL